MFPHRLSGDRDRLKDRIKNFLVLLRVRSDEQNASLFCLLFIDWLSGCLSIVEKDANELSSQEMIFQLLFPLALTTA